MTAIFCQTCGHLADKHAGTGGCIGVNTAGHDCFCNDTYSHIVSRAPALGKPPTPVGGQRNTKRRPA